MIKKIKNNKTAIIKTILTALAYVVVILLLIIFHKVFIPSESTKNKAQNYLKEGKIAFAIEHYKKFVRTHPQNYKAHIKLGNLYLEVRETDKAKVEYYRALKTAPFNNYSAHFALANLYIKNKEYELAEDLLNQVKESSTKKVNEQKGLLYTEIAKYYIDTNPENAFRKLKIAHQHLKLAKSKKIKPTEELITQITIKLANIFIAQNEKEESINILKNSIKYGEAAQLYNKLRSIYEVNDRKTALKYAQKAYETNKNEEYKKHYYKLLSQTAEYHAEQNHKTEAEYYSLLAKKLKYKKNIPYYNDKLLLLNITSSEFNFDRDNDALMPGVTFKLSNISKNEINYLNAKVIFYRNDKKISEVNKLITANNKTIKADSKIDNISIFSDKLLTDLDSHEKIKAEIYISTVEPDSWKLYRNTTISRH